MPATIKIIGLEVDIKNGEISGEKTSDINDIFNSTKERYPESPHTGDYDVYIAFKLKEDFGAEIIKYKAIASPSKDENGIAIIY